MGLDKPILKTNDITNYFGISTRTLDRWRKEKGFPNPIMKGSPNIYRREEVERWLNS
ncbi:hypothetical protein tloyanaT_13490 [Thalassotalea loyana]|uniref:Helix-turn-helix domain-containing protein n=1 Tax=Thalassotalea loyana TaxID=280483 RepID=A0ABQ6HED8_9GAMM|nr:helix-turn-helix domain-containing protein [Thalassotalea loyana]GLX85097.1 hypothetical protein tloyanaT_13490 [Thalassotalea loyana]